MLAELIDAWLECWEIPVSSPLKSLTDLTVLQPLWPCCPPLSSPVSPWRFSLGPAIASSGDSDCRQLHSAPPVVPSLRYSNPPCKLSPVPCAGKGISSPVDTSPPVASPPSCAPSSSLLRLHEIVVRSLAGQRRENPPHPIVGLPVVSFALDPPRFPASASTAPRPSASCLLCPAWSHWRCRATSCRRQALHYETGLPYQALSHPNTPTPAFHARARPLRLACLAAREAAPLALPGRGGKSSAWRGMHLWATPHATPTLACRGLGLGTWSA